MILKASQRTGAAQLANHLLRVDDNEHVQIHEIRGFVASDLHGALKEIQAVSMGTKCKQFMFSVSLNPPQKESAPVEYFENAITEIEDKMNLKNQPRVIVFHEKEGRRHAHVVWSRIDVDEMKAINLPFYKMKLQDISRQLYLQYGWEVPAGLLNKQNRNPLNFTLAQWQQAKRLEEDPKIIKTLFKQSWDISDCKESFMDALEENGYRIAQGDQRGFVAVDYRGEVFSLSRWMGVKTKELKAKLGNEKELPSVKDVQQEMAKKLTKQLQRYLEEAKANLQQGKEPFPAKKQAMVNLHREERSTLRKKHETRWNQESIARSHRLPRGLKGIWFRLTGKYKKIREQNEREVERSEIRDRYEKQTLIDRQLQERQSLQEEIQTLQHQHTQEMLELKQDIAHYMEIGGTPLTWEEKELPAMPEQTYAQEPEL